MNAQPPAGRCLPCPECAGLGRMDFGECQRCQGHGYIIVPDDGGGQPPKPTAICARCHSPDHHVQECEEQENPYG